MLIKWFSTLMHCMVVCCILLASVTCIDSTAPSSSTSKTQNSVLTRGITLIEDNGVWSEAIELFTNPLSNKGSIRHPQLVSNPSGDTFIAWQVKEPTSDAITINHYLLYRAAGSEVWQENAPFASDPEKVVIGLRLTSHAHSNAIYAVWQVNDTGVMQPALDTYVSRFTPKTHWSTPAHIGVMTATILNESTSVVLIDDKGESATLVWQTRSDNSTVELHARSYRMEFGLSVMATHIVGVPNNIQNPDYPDYEIFQPGPITGFIDKKGLAHVFYNVVRYSPDFRSGTDIWSGRFNSVTGWQAVELLDNTLNQVLVEDFEKLSMVQNPANDDWLLLVDAVNDGIYVLRSTSGQIESTEPLGSERGYFEISGFATNTDGQGFAVLGSSLNSSVLETRFFDFTNGWGQSENILPQPWSGGFSGGSQLAFNNHGDTAVLWRELSGEHYVLTGNASGIWSLPKLLVTKVYKRKALRPQMTLSDKGRLTVFWVESDQGVGYRVMLQEHQANMTNNLFLPSQIVKPVLETNKPNVPLLNQPPPVTDWQEPVIAWQYEEKSVNGSGFIQPPELMISRSTGVYFNVNADLNWQPSRLFTHDLVQYSKSGSWQSSDPPFNFGYVNHGISVVTDVGVGQAMGVTVNYKRELYGMGQSSSGEWLEEKLLSDDVDKYDLLNDNQGGAYLLWQTQADPLTWHTSHLSVLPTGELVSKVFSEVSMGDLSGEPQVNPQGQLALLWSTQSAAKQAFKLTVFSPETGWNTTYAPKLATGMDPASALLAGASDASWVVVVQRLPERQLYATTLNRQGDWSTWQSVDNNLGTIDAIMGQSRLKNNAQGQVMLLWVEETRVAGNIVHQIYSNQYTANHAAALTWGQPQFISDTALLAHHETPSLFLADNGQALVTWSNYRWRDYVNDADGLAIVYASRFEPLQGWSPAEPVTMSQQAVMPTGAILADGTAMIVWKGGTSFSYLNNAIWMATKQ